MPRCYDADRCENDNTYNSSTAKLQFSCTHSMIVYNVVGYSAVFDDITVTLTTLLCPHP